MRAVIQRVSNASVKCESGHTAEIKNGLLVLVGIEVNDNIEDITWLSGKISRLRLFDDEKGVMNLNVMDVNGEIMVISQFTLHASTRKGNRPSYSKAALPSFAIPLYNKFIQQLETDYCRPVKHGIFGDQMDVMLVNDGPVTLIIDTKTRE